jgi:hypothetical protein
MKYFTIKEFTKSETAYKLGINNIPTESIIKNLEKVAIFFYIKF